MKRSKPSLMTDVKTGDKFLLGYVALLVWITSYFRGMFFYEDKYWLFIGIAVFFALTAALKWSALLRSIHNHLLLYVLFTLSVLAYLLSSFSGVSPTAGKETVSWIAYFLFFVAVYVLLNGERVAVWLSRICWLLVIWIVALMFAVHLTPYEYYHAYVWERFSSVFQYPNTFASFVSAFILAGLLMQVKTDPKLKLDMRLITPLLPLFTVAFLLADSRGGILVFGAAWVVAFLLLRNAEKLMLTLYSTLLGVVSLAATLTYDPLVKEGNELLAFFVLVAAGAIYTFLSLLMRKLATRLAGKWMKGEWLVNALVLLLAVLLVFGLFAADLETITWLPETIKQISLEQHSVQERILFYKDSVEVWKDYPWFGAGGGAWRVLYEQYKSLPYSSTQAHSFYMQTLVEVGLIGALSLFAVFAFLIIRGLQAVFKQRDNTVLLTSMVIAITLLLHSAIDFNMTYGTYTLTLFVMLAILLRAADDQPIALMQRIAHSLERKGAQNVVRGTFVVLLLASVLITTYQSYGYARAHLNAQAAQNGGHYDQVLRLVDQALELDPKNESIRRLKIQLLYQGYEQFGYAENLDLINEEYEQLLLASPKNHRNNTDYAAYLWEIGRQAEALEQIFLAVDNGPWYKEIYTTLTGYAIEYLSAHRDEPQFEQYSNRFKQALVQLEELIVKQTTDIPAGYDVTHPIVLEEKDQVILAWGNYYAGRHNQSLQYLDQLGEDHAYQEEAALITALNYQHLNQLDELNELLEADAELASVFEAFTTDRNRSPF